MRISDWSSDVCSSDLIEGSGAEAAAHWLPEGVNVELNQARRHPRPGFANDNGKMAGWSRLCAYATQDGGKAFFQGLSPKVWTRLCAAIGRNDLLSPQHDDGAEPDDSLHAELTAIFARSEEHQSEIQSLMRNPYADLC